MGNPLYLKGWREAKGFSVRGLGEAAGVGFVTVTRAEQGHQSPTVETLEKIAAALGVDVGDLFRPPRGKAKGKGRGKR